MIPNVPVTHGNETAHRRLLGGAVNWVLSLFSGLANSTSGQVLTSDGNGGVQWGGNIVMADGEGIDFSAVEGGGASSSILDDYEEGTWTPVIADAASGGNTGGGTANGEYTKVGNIVTITGVITNATTGGLTAGSDVYIQGLPFTNIGRTNPGSCRINSLSSWRTDAYASVQVQASTAALRIAECLPSGAIDFLIVSQITSGTSDFYFSVTYRTTA